MTDKSPYGCVYGKTPDYSLFKIFGCLCHASVHDHDKFEPRTIRLVFVGYPPDHKGYKLLNLENKQIFISRHVVFQETVFPFHSNTHSAFQHDPYFLNQWMSTSDSTSSFFRQSSLDKFDSNHSSDDSPLNTSLPDSIDSTDTSPEPDSSLVILHLVCLILVILPLICGKICHQIVIH